MSPGRCKGPHSTSTAKRKTSIREVTILLMTTCLRYIIYTQCTYRCNHYMPTWTRWYHMIVRTDNVWDNYDGDPSRTPQQPRHKQRPERDTEHEDRRSCAVQTWLMFLLKMVTWKYFVHFDWNRNKGTKWYKEVMVLPIWLTIRHINIYQAIIYPLWNFDLMVMMRTLW